MRAALIFTLIALVADAGAQPCNSDCTGADKDDYGCCPAPKSRARLPIPALVPPPPNVGAGRLPERKQADAIAADAAAGNDVAKLLKCGTAYLDLYNKDPESPDNDEVLFQGGICYERARSLGVAIQLYTLLERYYPKSPHAMRGVLRKAYLFASIAYYDNAARDLERYAQANSSKPEAYDALIDAMVYRRGIGDDEKALADGRLVIRLYGAKRPADAAATHFGMLSIVEKRGDLEPQLAHLREYVQIYGDRGGVDRLIAAHARIGELEWRIACPGRAVDGVCAQTTRERRVASFEKPIAIPATCSAPALKRTMLARTANTATTSFTAAIKLYEAKGGKTGGFDPGALHFYALARLAVVDAELEKFLGAPVPKTAEALRLKYDAIGALGDPRAAIAATARIAQIARSMVDQLGTQPVPKTITTPDQLAAHCDKLKDSWSKLEVTANETCFAKASQLGIVDDWSRMCERELAILAPDKYPEHDAVAAPTFITPQVELAKPSTATGPGPFASALAAFAKDASPTDASCMRIAKAFTATAPTDLESAHYMAGYTYQRCGKIAEATQAYELAIKTKRTFAPALINLGVIAYRAAKTADAIGYWTEATKVDGKSVPARIGLAIAEYQQLIAIDPKDPKAKTLDEDVRYQLSNVLAVEPDRIKGYVLMALVHMRGADRNRNRLELARMLLDQAKQIDDKDPAVRIAAGLLAVHRGQLTHAVTEFQLASRVPDGALDLALLDLRLRRYDDAQRLLAALQPSYIVEVARGAAARGQRKLADAEAAYQRAIKHDPQGAEAYFDLGLLYLESKAGAEPDPAKAGPLYRRGRDYMKEAVSRALDPALHLRATDAVADADKTIKALRP